MKNNQNCIFHGGANTAKVYSSISRKIVLGLLVFVTAVIFQTQTIAQVGKQGTIFLEPKIITDENTSTFVGLDDAGQGERNIYDRRTETWSIKKVHLFRARFDDQTKTIEVRVNSEFDSESALTEAEKYLKVIGQIPFVLRNGLDKVTINKGNQLFGGPSKEVLIHTEQGEDYINKGILAETIIHEATHSVFDDLYAKSEGWIKAQKADNNFISNYARKEPEREDLAESFLMYIAIRYRGKRISAQTKKVVEEIMPNRIAFFDNLGLDVKPIYVEEAENKQSETDCSSEGKLRSVESSNSVEFNLTNLSVDTLSVYWLDFEGKRRKMFTIRPKEKVTKKTYLTHPWMVADANDACLQIIYAPGDFSIP